MLLFLVVAVAATLAFWKDLCKLSEQPQLLFPAGLIAAAVVVDAAATLLFLFLLFLLFLFLLLLLHVHGLDMTLLATPFL